MTYAGVAAAPRSKLICNFSSERMNTCAMEGDVRMHGKSATVYVVAASDDSYRPENGTVAIRPYPRKWETHSMLAVREVTIRSGATADAAPPPRCTVTHGVPAVVFSTGAYSKNFFHSMTDIVIPLYNTAREYDGHVQLVATNYNREWVSHSGTSSPRSPPTWSSTWTPTRTCAASRRCASAPRATRS